MHNQCEANFPRVLDRYGQELPIVLFSDVGCGHEIEWYAETGEFKWPEIVKSFIIPENYQVVMYKRVGPEQIMASRQFDPGIWGIGIDNVDDSIDRWTTENGEHVHSSFGDIVFVEVKKLGDRTTILASSCVGLQEPQVPQFEPSTSTKINDRCESLLDAYCSSTDPYHMDLCQYRKFYPRSTSTSTTDETPKDDDHSTGSNFFQILIYIICAVLILCIPIFIIPRIKNKYFSSARHEKSENKSNY